MKIDYIIVGDGYAALFFAHQLIKNNKTFALFSEGKKSASQVSAGIINPVVLKKFTTFWKAEEQIQKLKKTLEEIQQYTGKNYWIEENIHRIFHDDNEKKLWLKKAETEDLAPFLDTQLINLKELENSFQSGRVQNSARLDVGNFFVDILQYIEKNHILFKEKFEYNHLNPNEKRYKDLEYQYIIFAEGMGVKENPYFSNIPVNPNKGHHLKAKLSTKLPENKIVKKKHFLFPIDEGLYYYGGTYDREQFHEEIDESAVAQLKNGIQEIYKHSFEVKEIQFGFRPTVKDRRPIIGSHSEYRSLFVFNGLGARGILNGSYFSEKLFTHIEKNAPLPSEVHLDRWLGEKS